jgi:hypothetical protein
MPAGPAAAGHLFAELEQPISPSDILDFDEFRKSRFYMRGSSLLFDPMRRSEDR